jgi:outer membrane protein assembly factor BamD
LVHVSPAALVWRPGEGWSYESSDATLAASDAKDQLQLARNYEAKEDWGSALSSYKSLVRRWPMSSVAGEAQFKVGFMLEKMAEFYPAFEAYDKVVKKYPNSQFFDLAIERQFAIGNLFLSGEPQRLWKIPLLPSMDRTVKIYQAVIKNAPYGKYAAKAYFNMGQAREKQKKWSDAIAAYNMILDKYPNDPLADDAQYQIGYAWFRASSEADYDQSAARKSIEGFQDYLAKFPNSDKREQAKEYIEILNGRQVQGSFNIAKFYDRQKNYKAAFIYYNDVIQINPESEQSQQAKARIEAIRPLIEGDPMLSSDQAPKALPRETAAANGLPALPSAARPADAGPLPSQPIPEDAVQLPEGPMLPEAAEAPDPLAVPPLTLRE